MATKPTTPKTPKAPAKPRATAPKVAKPKPVQPVADMDTVAAGGAEAAAKGAAGMRLKELVDMVATSTEVKKKDVKTVIEAALAAMGEALKKGESLNLVGLGKLRVVRAAAEGGAMTLKLRQGGPAEKGEKAAAEPLAEAEDQD